MQPSYQNKPALDIPASVASLSSSSDGIARDVRFGTPEWVHTCQALPKELGGKPKVPGNGFRFSCLVEERHKQDLYGTAFCHLDGALSSGLAVVGGRHSSIYVARGAPSFSLELRQTYKD